MFIRAPSRIVFDDTYAAPWQSLIFPNFKDCIKTEALRSWHLAKERKNTLWTEIMVQFGREETRRVDCRLSRKDGPLSNADN